MNFIPQRIGMIAGEASGDLLGASLVAELKSTFPNTSIEGIGGPAMSAAGFRSLFDMERLSVVGLIEPIKHLPDLWRLRRDIFHYFKQNRPDIFIGIDAPDFNLGLEIKLRKLGIPITHIVSPSVWAWRKNRIYKIAKAVDLMMTLFPFEEKFYQQHQIPVRYVGHPLAEKIPIEIDQASAREVLGIDRQRTCIVLLPGSRRQEIYYLSPVFLQAAYLLWQQHPDWIFITSHLRADREQAFLAYVKKFAPNLPIKSFLQRSHEVMAAADAGIVASGTATLEMMLHKKPMVIAYRLSPLTFAIAKRLVTPPIGLPNILANERLVPELIQHEATPEALAQAINHYFLHNDRLSLLKNNFTQIHRTLHKQSAKEMVAGIAGLICPNK